MGCSKDAPSVDELNELLNLGMAGSHGGIAYVSQEENQANT